VFLVAQLVALAAAAIMLRIGLHTIDRRPARVAAAMMAGCMAGGALLHPLLRLARGLFGQSADPFAPGWPTAYGALVGAAVAVAFTARDRKAALDAFLPAAGLLIFFGRLGCLAAGCCFGHVTDHTWGVTYPPGSPAYVRQVLEGALHPDAMRSLPIVPAAGLEAMLGLGLVVLGLASRGRVRAGVPFAAGALLYAIGRFGIEWWRADPRPMAGPISLPQAISLVVAAVAIGLLSREPASQGETRGSASPSPGHACR
jgi:prolipoprotein diacylglyceryltransferase